MASEIPDLEIVLPDGRPVSEFMEEEADLSTEIEFEGDPEGEITEVITVEISEMENPFYDNLAEAIADDDPQVLAQVASNLTEDFEGDLSARKDWLQTYADGMELLGLKIEDRSEPWAGACGVFHPLLSEALVKFQAETVMETLPAGGPVKTKIIGKETKENKRASINVAANMNYYIQEKMPEYRGEHERMLWGLGLAGNAFKKVYYDPATCRPASIYVPAEDMVVPYGASSLDDAERVTHVMRKTENDVRKLQVSGFYRDIELEKPGVGYLDDIEKKIAENMGFSATSDDRYKILEFHVNIDLKGYEDKDEKGKETGIALPYIVTLERTSNEILAIRRNWMENDPKKMKRQHFVHYPYIPGFGFYAFGLVHLLGSFAKSGTSLIRQLVDAGTLSNLPGGFKAKGMRIKGDDTPIQPAEFRDVDLASGSIRENILPLPYKEPSQVLFNLMQSIVEEGRRFASIADLKISDMSSQSPVGTTLAILERTLKVMSSVQARVHAAMKQEFKILAQIIRDDTPTSYSYDPASGEPQVKQADYDMVEVVPVSNPNSSTMAQKVVQYQTVMQLAQASPQIYDMPELHKQMLETIGIENVGKIIPSEDEQKPQDPVFENMNLLNGKPVKAFMYQDHESHIKVHMNAMQDPYIQQILQNNPAAPNMDAAAQAHIAEHLAFLYRAKLEEQLGVALPDTEEKLPEGIEVQLSKLVADASEQLLQQNQQRMAQEQALEKAQDPVIQMQQAELELKYAELERKSNKDKTDAEIKGAEVGLDAARIQSEEKKAMAKLLAEAVKDDEEQKVKQIIEGAKLGADAAKHANGKMSKQ
jgi:hypothetical protein|tara:strand:+ start:616 stop:3075 length:2460 start_codon:yes stop_codon:yes gene_type:complete